MRIRSALLLLCAVLFSCRAPNTEAVHVQAVEVAAGDPLLLSGFGIAQGEHIGQVITADGDRMVPNLLYAMEGPLGDPNAVRTDLHARSGRWSFHFPEGAEYGPSIARRVRDVARDLSAIRVQLWLLSNAPDPRMNIVIRIMRNGTEQITWYGKEMKSSEHVPGRWERFNAELLIRDLDVRPDDSLFIELWDREKVEVFVDDLAVSFICGASLTGTPAPKTRRAPLPYAEIHCDSIVHGIFPAGAAAPAAGPRDIPITPGSSVHWHYAPGDGVALLIDHQNGAYDTIALVRPFCAGVGDLLHFDRLRPATATTGLSMTAFDVDRTVAEDGSVRESIAAQPPPVRAFLHIDLPGQ